MVFKKIEFKNNIEKFYFFTPYDLGEFSLKEFALKFFVTHNYFTGFPIPNKILDTGQSNLSISKSSLSFDHSDDVKFPQVNLKELVNVLGDLLLRAPGPTSKF